MIDQIQTKGINRIDAVTNRQYIAATKVLEKANFVSKAHLMLFKLYIRSYRVFFEKLLHLAIILTDITFMLSELDIQSILEKLDKVFYSIRLKNKFADYHWGGLIPFGAHNWVLLDQFPLLFAFNRRLV
jgi:hypothetical protein